MIKRLLITLSTLVQRLLLGVSHKAWSLAVESVNEADAIDVTKYGMITPYEEGALRLNSAQQILCDKLSAATGAVLVPNELTRRLIQAAHWSLRIKNLLN